MTGAGRMPTTEATSAVPVSIGLCPDLTGSGMPATEPFAGRAVG